MSSTLMGFFMGTMFGGILGALAIMTLVVGDTDKDLSTSRQRREYED